MEILGALLLWQLLLTALACGFLLFFVFTRTPNRSGLIALSFSSWGLIGGAILGLLPMLDVGALVGAADYVFVFGPPAITAAICIFLLSRIRIPNKVDNAT